MSELRKLKKKHRKEIQDLQDGCAHPSSVKMPVMVADGVWGQALFCSRCSKQLEWIEEPKRTHEVEYIPVELIR